jgi:hypothetical protein
VKNIKNKNKKMNNAENNCKSHNPLKNNKNQPNKLNNNNHKRQHKKPKRTYSPNKKNQKAPLIPNPPINTKNPPPSPVRNPHKMKSKKMRKLSHRPSVRAKLSNNKKRKRPMKCPSMSY